MRFPGRNESPVIHQFLLVTGCPSKYDFQLPGRKVMPSNGFQGFNINGNILAGKTGMEMRRQMIIPIDINFNSFHRTDRRHRTHPLHAYYITPPFPHATRPHFKFIIPI